MILRRIALLPLSMAAKRSARRAGAPAAPGPESEAPVEHILRIDPRYFRPTEVDTLLGDPAKAKAKLGWTPEVTLPQMIEEMIEADLMEAQHAVLIRDNMLAR